MDILKWFKKDPNDKVKMQEDVKLIKVINESIGILETVLQKFITAMQSRPGPLGYEILSIRKSTKTQPYQRQECPICAWALERASDNIIHCRYCGWVDDKPLKRKVARP